jgi:hypothetical protein
MEALTPQDLVRKAVIAVAQLQENELLIVIETVESLKKQRAHANRESAKEIVARAKARAAEMRDLPRAELMKKFSDTLDAIRADAIANDTAVEGELDDD